eukprot:1728021-Amphidinium_carterae.1
MIEHKWTIDNHPTTCLNVLVHDYLQQHCIHQLFNGLLAQAALERPPDLDANGNCENAHAPGFEAAVLSTWAAWRALAVAPYTCMAFQTQKLEKDLASNTQHAVASRT